MSMSDRLIVMNAGGIEQSGRPDEVYRNPRTAFAADFMGRSNSFPILAASVQDRVVELQTAIGRLIASDADAGDARPGSRVFVRPEHVAVAPPGPPQGEANSLPGRVRRTTFLGAASSVEIELSDGAVLLALVPNGTEPLPYLAPGAEIVARIPPAALKILQH